MKIKSDEILEKAGHAIRENVAHIIFAAVVLLMIVVSFVDMGVGDGVINWVDLVVNLALQLTVFIPYRWRQKRVSGHAEPYKDNKRLYEERVNALRNNNDLTKFAEFCKAKTVELKYEKQLTIVHAFGIDTEVYELLTAKILTAEEIKRRDELAASLTEQQQKALRRAQRVKVKPVNPLCITSNGNKVNGYGVDFNDTAEDVIGIAGKVFPLILWAFILSVIAFLGISDGGITALVVILFRTVMCLSAMFSGIMSGDGFVAKKDKVILRRIDFIDLFHEWLAAEKGETIKPAELPKQIRDGYVNMPPSIILPSPELPDDTVKTE